MDVPVKASYMIGGSDDDGFLEDGIIVKTKGTGYIDQRYRNRDPYRASASQIIYGRPGNHNLYLYSLISEHIFSNIIQIKWIDNSNDQVWIWNE